MLLDQSFSQSIVFITVSQFLLHFILTHTGISLAVQVRLTSQVHNGIKQQSHRRLTSLDTLCQSQSLLHIPADGFKAVLKLFITVTFLLATGVVAAVMLVATFGHRWNTYVKLKSKERGSTSIGWWLLVPRTRDWLVAITTPVVTQPIVTAKQVQGYI